MKSIHNNGAHIGAKYNIHYMIFYSQPGPLQKLLQDCLQSQSFGEQ